MPSPPLPPALPLPQDDLVPLMPPAPPPPLLWGLPTSAPPLPPRLLTLNSSRSPSLSTARSPKNEHVSNTKEIFKSDFSASNTEVVATENVRKTQQPENESENNAKVTASKTDQKTCGEISLQRRHIMSHKHSGYRPDHLVDTDEDQTNHQSLESSMMSAHKKMTSSPSRRRRQKMTKLRMKGKDHRRKKKSSQQREVNALEKTRAARGATRVVATSSSSSLISLSSSLSSSGGGGKREKREKREKAGKGGEIDTRPLTNTVLSALSQIAQVLTKPITSAVGTTSTKYETVVVPLSLTRAPTETPPEKIIQASLGIGETISRAPAVLSASTTLQGSIFIGRNLPIYSSFDTQHIITMTESLQNIIQPVLKPTLLEVRGSDSNLSSNFCFFCVCGDFQRVDWWEADGEARGCLKREHISRIELSDDGLIFHMLKVQQTKTMLSLVLATSDMDMKRSWFFGLTCLLDFP